jgi:hypothetical protein
MHVLEVLGPLHGEFFNPKEFCVKKTVPDKSKMDQPSPGIQQNYSYTAVVLIFVLLGRKQEAKGTDQNGCNVTKI